jgi:hypothetical protein
MQIHSLVFAQRRSILTAPDLSLYTEMTVAAVSVLHSTSRGRFRSKPRSALASPSGDCEQPVPLTRSCLPLPRL